MTALLDYAMETARSLPPERQDEIARMVLAYAGDEEPVALTEDERAAIAASKAEAARGEFATSEEIRAVWASFER